MTHTYGVFVLTALNPCEYNNGGCEQTCVRGTSLTDYTCQCDAGYRLDNNDRSCTPLGQSAAVITGCNAVNSWRRGVVVSGVRRMNQVNARRARLVLGWVTVFGRLYHLCM